MEEKQRPKWLVPVGIGCLVILCLCIGGGAAYYFFFADNMGQIFDQAGETIDAVTTEVSVLPTETSGVAAATLPAEDTSPPPANTQAPQPTLSQEGSFTGQQYLDDVSLFDDFSSDYFDWQVYEDEITIIKYENSAYSFQIAQPDYYDYTYVPAGDYPNYIEFDVQGLPGPQNGTFGLMCQLQDGDNYYYVEFDLELREYLVGVVKNGEHELLTPLNEDDNNWQPADSFTSLPEQTNKIAVDCTLDALTLSINGTQVYTTTFADPFATEGEMAFFVFAFSFADENGYKVFFDNANVWWGE